MRTGRASRWKRGEDEPENRCAVMHTFKYGVSSTPSSLPRELITLLTDADTINSRYRSSQHLPESALEPRERVSRLAPEGDEGPSALFERGLRVCCRVNARSLQGAVCRERRSEDFSRCADS
jgi:hypothetical protein